MNIFVLRASIIFLLLNLNVAALEVKELANSLKLSAGSKAVVQWERVFSSDRKMKRYMIDTLTVNKQNELKAYLINHAIDSDHPTVAGE